MAEPLRREPFIEAPPSERRLSTRAQSAAYQAYLILYVGFIVAPLIAGADKFFHLLVNWDQYLAPAIAGMLPVAPHTFMLAVGVIEMAAAALVAAKPSIGAYVVTAWLW